MTTEDALLAAVLAAPDDDLRRLVLADHYEGELGQPERAEFIRVQVEIARACSCIHDWRGEIEWTEFRPKCGRTSGNCPDSDRLRRRETELLDENAYLWFPPPLVACLSNTGTLFQTATPGMIAAHITRGLISQIHCTLSEWCGGECPTCRPPVYRPFASVRGNVLCNQCRGTGRTAGIGPQIVKRHPVKRVVLTDREPLEGVSKFWMWSQGISERPHAIPLPVWSLLTDYAVGSSTITRFYPTREAALSALSAALIAWAKSQPDTAADTTLEMMSSHP